MNEVIATRPTAQSEADSNLVFITKYGNRWSNADERHSNPISDMFRRFVADLGMYRKNVTTFYSLRRTFETIGATAGDQVAVNYIMGHIPATDDMAQSIVRRRLTAHCSRWRTTFGTGSPA